MKNGENQILWTHILTTNRFSQTLLANTISGSISLDPIFHTALCHVFIKSSEINEPFFDLIASSKTKYLFS